MSSHYVIVCKTCRSYRTRRVADPRPGVRRYHCLRCRAQFDVADVAGYVEEFPPDLHRCNECDSEGVELVERNYRFHSNQPADAVTDLYQCSRCGHKFLNEVQRSAHSLDD